MLTYWRYSIFCSWFLVTSLETHAHATEGDRVVRISAFEQNLHNYSRRELQENFGCRNSLPVGHFAQARRDAAACPGEWRGHVSGAELCAPAWHVCSSKDSSLLDALMESELFSLPGCYAMNAAHQVGKAGCGDCSEAGGDKVVMTGMGGGCAYYNRSDHSSCLAGARIDLPETEMRAGAKCAHKSYVSGVVCCRNSRPAREESPQVLDHGYHVHNLQVGRSVTVECKGRGHPTPPAVNWFRDGLALSPRDGRLTISSRVDERNLTVSTLTIARVEMSDHQSQLSCEASSRYGREGGVHHLLKVWKSQRRGCRKGVEQFALPGGETFACKGRWRGHVRSASKRLCGKRYQVCGALGEGTRVLDRTGLAALLGALPGCYALDAATTKREYCDRCNPRHRGNRMLGVGAGCGSVAPDAESCLGRGTVQVWPDAGRPRSGSNHSARVRAASERARRSCGFDPELTTGVLCCRKPISAMFERKRLVCSPRCEGGGRCVAGQRCSCPMWRSGDRCQINLLETRSCAEVCGPHAGCNRRRTRCKCSKGYKMLRNKCVAK